MTTINLTRLSRLAIRRRIKPTTSSSVVVVRPAASSSRIPLHPRPRPQLSQKAIVAVTSNCNYFSTSSHLTRPLDPDVLSRVKPNILPDSLYHELSDQYLDNLLYKLEAWQDERDDLDVEYSAGVMNIKITNIGTYVINKQPPNKQIWLSSPVSGPKRFDYVAVEDRKEGTVTGKWVYLRDGTTLDEILSKEIERTPPSGFF